jgi:protein TonB
MRDGASRALAIAFVVSILLHAAIFGLLPRLRELAALVPPEPVPLIARVVRAVPPPPAPIQELRKPAPPPPVVRAPTVQSVPATASEPERAPEPQAQVPALPQAEPAPAPAPAPVIVAPAPPPAPTIDPGALERYRQGVIGQAARYKRYPRAAIDNNWEGEVVVRMTIGADGRIAALRVARSSGHEVLDRQALEMFRDAKPFVQVPGELRGREFELELRAVYNLRDQRSG